MAQFLLILSFIFADAFWGLAMASENVQTMVHSNIPPSSHPQSPTPSSSKGNLHEAQVLPIIRKLGKHHHQVPVPSPSPSTEAIAEVNVSIREQQIQLPKHHHAMDKSVAGGGVILGGLATTFLVSVFCYIRATGRHKAESSAPTIASAELIS